MHRSTEVIANTISPCQFNVICWRGVLNCIEMARKKKTRLNATSNKHTCM